MFLVEFFIPLSVKYSMDIHCREALLNMEKSGGLDVSTALALKEGLEKEGFSNIKITGSDNAQYGDKLKLKVEAEYCYNKLSSSLSRGKETRYMCYDKTALSRKVIN
jgi:hypothetical protein